jgi:hypothetical protein
MKNFFLIGFPLIDGWVPGGEGLGPFVASDGQGYPQSSSVTPGCIIQTYQQGGHYFRK